MCPPGHASSRDPFTGRHTGRPLQIPLQHPLTPQKRTGTEPRPYRSIVVPSSGLMYLRHGFRRPNFVPKFGASVIGIGPYERTGNGSPRPPQGRNLPSPVTPGWFPKEGPQPFLWSFQGGPGREIEIPPGIFLGDPPLTGSGPSPAGRTAPAGRGISLCPEGDAACQTPSGSQSLFSLQKPRGID